MSKRRPRKQEILAAARRKGVSPESLVSPSVPDVLKNWNALCPALSKMTLQQVDALLALEVAGKRRPSILYRLHTRKVGLIKAALWAALARGRVVEVNL